MRPIETHQYRDHTINVHQDSDSESPREWDNLGKMACWHRRHTLGDEQPSETPEEYLKGLARECVAANYPEALLEKNYRSILEANYVVLPLYLYDHSGLSMSTSPFSCPWDSGQVGVVHVSLKDLLAEHGLAKGTLDTKVPGRADGKTLRQFGEEVLKGEVSDYSDYISGAVYRYEIVDRDSRSIDGCGGYIGHESCRFTGDPKTSGHMIADAMSTIDSLIERSKDTEKPAADEGAMEISKLSPPAVESEPEKSGRAAKSMDEV